MNGKMMLYKHFS